MEISFHERKGLILPFRKQIQSPIKYKVADLCGNPHTKPNSMHFGVYPQYTNVAYTQTHNAQDMTNLYTVSQK